MGTFYLDKLLTIRQLNISNFTWFRPICAWPYVLTKTGSGVPHFTDAATETWSGKPAKGTGSEWRSRSGAQVVPTAPGPLSGQLTWTMSSLSALPHLSVLTPRSKL